MYPSQLIQENFKELVLARSGIAVGDWTFLCRIVFDQLLDFVVVKVICVGRPRSERKLSGGGSSGAEAVGG